MCQGDTADGSLKKLSEPWKQAAFSADWKKWNFVFMKRIQEVIGGKLQCNVVMENQASLWPPDHRQSCYSCSSSDKGIDSLKVYLWNRKYTVNITLTTHLKFQNSLSVSVKIPLLTIQCSISGFIKDNSRIAFNVAFMEDKVHGRNPEAVCSTYQKRQWYLCFYFLKVGQKSLPYHVDTACRSIEDKEQKCSTQNSTQTLLIKVISLKE